MAVLMHVIDSGDEVDVEEAVVFSVIARKQQNKEKQWGIFYKKNCCDVKHWACLEFFVLGICLTNSKHR